MLHHTASRTEVHTPLPPCRNTSHGRALVSLSRNDTTFPEAKVRQTYHTMQEGVFATRYESER